jgi:gas vesicle protein
LRVYPGTVTSASGFDILRTGLATLFTGLQVTQNGVLLAPTAINFAVGTGKTSVTLSGGSTLVNLSSGTGYASADRIRLVGFKATAQTWLAKQTAAGVNVPGIGGVVGKQIKVYVGHTSGVAATAVMTAPSSGAVLRCQSCTINGDLSREDLKELGNTRIVNKRLNTPLKLSATIEAAESDLEEYAKMIGSGAPFATYSTGTSNINVFWNNELAAGSNIWLHVVVYKDRTGGFAAGQILKTITMSGLSLTSKSRDMGATSRGTVSFGLGGSYITVAASGLSAT